MAWTFPLLEAFRVLENNLSGAHYMHRKALHVQHQPCMTHGQAP
jgi:hypothetical protein